MHMHTHVVKKFKQGNLILSDKGYRGTAIRTHSLLATGYSVAELYP